MGFTFAFNPASFDADRLALMRRWTNFAWMSGLRTIFSALSLLLFGACAVTEQTPTEVGQKFEEGIKGNGTIVPEDKDRSQTGPSENSPVTKPAGVPPS